MAVNSELLGSLEKALSNVLYASDYLKKKSFTDKLINTVRKLRIAEELHQLYYVAIAGSQSAGKTRLIRELYGLNEDWLKDNEGRGERLPVFVLETDDPRAPFATQITVDGGAVSEGPISASDFRKLVSGAAAPSNVLFPKLYVPRRHFPTGDVGFVLLPGYEVENLDNVGWQRVMRHTLKHALGCVLVTDSTRIADSRQQDILRDMSSTYFADRVPLIVISKSESMPEEKRAELRQRAHEVFAVPEHQSSRIVLTGTGNATLIENWSKELIGALEYYSLQAGTSCEARIKELEDLVDNELCAIQGLIEDALESDSISLGIPERQRENVLDIFDKARDQYRRHYDRQVNEQVNEYASNARTRARDRYIQEEEGFVNTVIGGIGNFLTKTSGERENEHIRRIHECWQEAPSGSTSLAERQFIALSRMANTQLGVAAPESEEALRDLSSQGVQKMLGYEQKLVDSPVSHLESRTVQIYMAQLLNPQRGETVNQLTAEEKEQFEDMVKLIPAVTMEYLRLNQGLMLSSEKQLPARPSTENLESFIKSINQDLPAVHESAKSLLRTMGCILAVDVVIDGQIDTVPALLQAIFGGGAEQTAGTLGASLSVAAAGAIMLGFIAYRGIQAAQRHDAAQRGYINEVMMNLATDFKARQMEIYDDAMERVRDRLHRGLGVAYRLDAGLSQRDNLLRALSALEVNRLRVLRGIREQQLLA